MWVYIKRTVWTTTSASICLSISRIISRIINLIPSSVLLLSTQLSVSVILQENSRPVPWDNSPCFLECQPAFQKQNPEKTSALTYKQTSVQCLRLWPISIQYFTRLAIVDDIIVKRYVNLQRPSAVNLLHILQNYDFNNSCTGCFSKLYYNTTFLDLFEWR
jgi:hypothetical protein